MNLTQFEWVKTESRWRRYGLNKLVYFLCISRFVFLKRNGNKTYMMLSCDHGDVIKLTIAVAGKRPLLRRSLFEMTLDKKKLSK